VLTAKAKPSPKEILKLYERAVPDKLRRANRCIGCGVCAPHCPQSIKIPGELAAIDEWIDGIRAEVVK
jgi:hypothetical protein